MYVQLCSNMTYQFGMSEKAKMRMEECGHVNLTDAETMKLSKTRSLSIFIVVAGLSAPKPYMIVICSLDLS